jgi:hypothetical protein
MCQSTRLHHGPIDEAHSRRNFVDRPQQPLQALVDVAADLHDGTGERGDVGARGIIPVLRTKRKQKSRLQRQCSVSGTLCPERKVALKELQGKTRNCSRWADCTGVRSCKISSPLGDETFSRQLRKTRVGSLASRSCSLRSRRCSYETAACRLRRGLSDQSDRPTLDDDILEGDAFEVVRFFPAVEVGGLSLVSAVGLEPTTP